MNSGTNEPLVSVITPFFKTPPQFMREAIESVIAQTYSHWELILVDDGSTPESTEVARRYATQFPSNIFYFEHDYHRNRGASASRNLGINHARGDFIALLDADDLWLPHKLKAQVEILVNQPAAVMVYGATQYWYSWTRDSHTLKPDRVMDIGLPAGQLIDPPNLLIQHLQRRAAIPSPCSIMIRRHALDDIGLFEEGFPDLYDDQVFYAKIFLRAPVFVSNQCWDRYRQHPDSLCAIAARTQQTRVKHLAYLRWLESYLRKEHFKHPDVWQSLQEELRFYEDPRRFSMNKMRRYLIRRSRKLRWRLSAKLLFRPNRD